MPITNGREQVFNEGIKNNDPRPADETAEFLVTQNTDGTQGKIETSTVIGGINIQILVDNDPKTAFIDGSNSTVSIMEGSVNNRTFGATVGDGEDVSSSLGVNNNYSQLQNAQLNKESTVGVELGLVKISQANPSGSTNISVDAPIAETNWKTPAKVAGDYVYASTSDIFTKIQFTADGIQDSFDLATTALSKAVFWNGALLDDADWSQTSNTLTLTFIPVSGDIIKPI